MRVIHSSQREETIWKTQACTARYWRTMTDSCELHSPHGGHVSVAAFACMKGNFWVRFSYAFVQKDTFPWACRPDTFQQVQRKFFDHWNKLEASWNVMAHAQKRDFVFRRNGRVYLNRRRASVQSTTDSQVLRISGSNGIYTMFRRSVKGTGYPLHPPVSPSILLPCVTVYHHISSGVYCMHI